METHCHLERVINHSFGWWCFLSESRKEGIGVKETVQGIMYLPCTHEDQSFDKRWSGIVAAHLKCDCMGDAERSFQGKPG